MTTDEQSNHAKQLEPTKVYWPALGVLICIGLALVLRRDGIQEQTSIATWLRALNVVLLAIHASGLSGYFIVVVQVYAQKQVTAKAVVIAGVLLAGTVYVSLGNIFSWSVLANEGPLLVSTLVSVLLALYEIVALHLNYRNWRIRQYTSQGNYQAALDLLRPKLQQNTVSYWDLIDAGICHVRLGQIEEGERLIQEGLSRSNRDPIALTQVICFYHVQKRYDEGLQLNEEVIAAIGEKPVLLYNRCLFLAEIGHLDEARLNWDRLKQLQDPATLVPKNDRDGQIVFTHLRTLLAESTDVEATRPSASE